MQTLVSNLANARAFMLAFGIVWAVFIVYAIGLIQTRKKIVKQMELLKHIKK